MLRLLRADHRHRLHGLRSRLLQCHRMSQRSRHWLHTANQSAGSVASCHWATPHHSRLAIPMRILCHTQVNLTECRPSRPCDGERDREHNISAASSGDAFVQHSISLYYPAASRGTLVQHSISASTRSRHACSTFHEPVLRHFALSSPPPVRTMTVISHGSLVCFTARVPCVFIVMWAAGRV